MLHSRLSRSLVVMTMVALLLASVLSAPVSGLYGGYPQSCAEVRLQNPAAGDGEYTLALDGKTARIYCADMAGTPAEYISLSLTGGSYNYSMHEGDHQVHFPWLRQWWMPYWVLGTDAITHYNKVRIDPTTLVVDRNDMRFAVITSEGVNGSDPTNPNFKPVPKTMRYAEAADCYSSWSARGKGNVNLTGTDFAIDNSVSFAVGGWDANGSVTMSPSRQIVTMTGGGWCGGTAPTGPLKLKLLTAAIPLDQIPPVTTATAPVGWQSSDVTVTLAATDDASGVAATYYTVDGGATQTGNSILVTADGVHTLAFWSVDQAGNTETAKSVTVSVDKTAPTVTYTGNTGSYTVDQAVSITCSAADATSGVAAHTCQSVTGPAYTFALGTNAYSATATDYAGNSGAGAASFAVSVTHGSLCGLVRQFSDSTEVADGLCDKLNAAAASAARGNAKSGSGQISAFLNQVKAQTGKALTAAEAAVLTALAGAL